MPRRTPTTLLSLTEIEVERFFSKVKITSGCWCWTGTVRNKDGYGACFLLRKLHMAHRVSWVIHRGPIPENLIVRHSCDNPICVNPEHLRLGTDADNWEDCQQRGRERHPKGEEHGKARLTEEDVKMIRKQYRPRRVPKWLFAELFGVSVSCIGHVVSGKNWKS